MFGKVRSLHMAVAAAALSVLVGMAGPALAAKGYVGNINGLTAISAPGFELAYGKGGALPKGYTKVYVAPVGIIEGQDKMLDSLSAFDRKEMQDYLFDQLTHELGAKFTLVNTPQAGALVIAASFTALTPNKPTMSQLKKNPGLDYGRSFGIGRAGIQIDVRDGASGDLLAAFVDYEEGQSLDTNTNTITLWGDAQEFSRDWAGNLTKSISS